MGKKIFTVLIFLVLGYITNIIVSTIDAALRNNFLGGESGFPLRSTKQVIFSQGSVDMTIESINIIFWSVVLFIIWILIKKLLKK